MLYNLMITKTKHTRGYNVQMTTRDVIDQQVMISQPLVFFSIVSCSVKDLSISEVTTTLRNRLRRNHNVALLLRRYIEPEVTSENMKEMDTVDFIEEQFNQFLEEWLERVQPEAFHALQSEKKDTEIVIPLTEVEYYLCV